MLQESRVVSDAAPRARSIVFAIGALVAVATISACSVSELMSPRPDVDIGHRSAAIQVPAVQGTSPPAVQEVAPSNVYLAGYPRVDNPLVQHPGAMPAHEAACRNELKRLGVSFRDLGSIDDGGGCRIDHPVEVTGFSGDIALKPAATLSCEMALSLARWTKNELAPAARTRYFSGIRTIHQGSSYSCRRIRGSGTMSEHAKGNALDIMRIELKNGRDIDVRKPGWFAFRQRGFLNTVRADGCDYFTTVLGPGYDADHKDHFHFDIKERRNGRRACR